MEWVPEFNFQLSVKLGGSIFQKACFLEIKEYALNTSLKKQIFSMKIVIIYIWMIKNRQNRYMDDNKSSKLIYG